MYKISSLETQFLNVYRYPTRGIYVPMPISQAIRES